MTSTIDTRKYFFNKGLHVEMATEINLTATRKGVSVSRWVTSRGIRRTVTYIVHTGERNQYASKQGGVLFKIFAEERGQLRDEMKLLVAVADFLETLPEPQPVVRYAITARGSEILGSENLLWTVEQIRRTIEYCLQAGIMKSGNIDVIGKAVLVNGEVVARRW